MLRKYKKLELWQLWRRDQNLVIAKYHEIVGGVHSGHPEVELAPRQVIDAIIEHEESQLTTARVLRSIAA